MNQRRRIDQVLDPGFVSGIADLGIEDVRERRALSGDVENELSYYRRMLHGRMDLIRFEQRRRSGEEKRSLIEALPSILADPESGHRSGRYEVPDLPPLPDVGHREIDHILGDDVLIRLDAIDDAGLESALEAIQEIEAEISEQRRQVQAVEDAFVEELAARYRVS
ncbi:MAG: aerial mycelium formation protein [Acidimicrobiia bacterium]|nr:aerial mycelium formation protein [Acidimicrobiia bacterium]MDH4307039.1 aerial mycelium formation protein [Acidimicrobiia bacterium]